MSIISVEQQATTESNLHQLKQKIQSCTKCMYRTLFCSKINLNIQ